MRDLSRVGASGIGRSRGYAFVAFTEHNDALHALRATNNRPEIFGDNKVVNMTSVHMQPHKHGILRDFSEHEKLEES